MAFTLESAVTVSPSIPVSGSPVTITGTLRNTGTSTSSVSVYAFMGTPGILMASGTFMVIGGNSPSVTPLTFTIPSSIVAGNYQFCLSFLSFIPPI